MSETDIKPAENAPSASAIPAAELDRLTDDIVGALKSVYDPEIPVDIYELGLIYEIRIAPGGKVDVEMTLTAPGCPVAGSMPDMVRDAVEQVEGVSEAAVELVWEPPWDRTRMSEVAQLELGMW